MMRGPLDVEAAYTRILKVLRGAIRASGHTQVEIDRAIGRRRGYLSHVFHRRVHLKVRELLAVIRALDLEPSHLLGTLVVGPRPQERPLDQEELLTLLAEAVAGPVDGVSAAEEEVVEEMAAPSPMELEAMVEELVEQVLSQQLPPQQDGGEGGGGQDGG